MVYRSLLRPILFSLPPETAHHLALASLSLIRPVHQLVARQITANQSLRVKRFGLIFPNPVGLAAGFDKNGTALRELSALGFGHIEAGTVTHHAQPGNPRPRLFRLPKDQALINRAGFNNDGAAVFAQRVRSSRPNIVLGVSIGKSKITPLENAVEDYLGSFELVYDVADYVAVNVSSPNTPGLRDLQGAGPLDGLLRTIQKENQISRKPIVVKIAPDLSLPDLEQVIVTCEANGIAGIDRDTTPRSRRQPGLRTRF